MKYTILFPMLIFLQGSCVFIPYDPGISRNIYVFDSNTKESIKNAFIELKVSSRYYTDEAGNRRWETIYLRTDESGKALVRSKYSHLFQIKINHS